MNLIIKRPEELRTFAKAAGCKMVLSHASKQAMGRSIKYMNLWNVGIHFTANVPIRIARVTYKFTQNDPSI